MQMRKNHQVAFAALAFLSASASGSPVQPLAHADIHVRSLQERDIPIVAEVIPLNARSAADGPAGSNRKRQSGPIREVSDGLQYTIHINVGDTDLEVLFATGTSSFWVPQAHYVCLGDGSKVVPQSDCGFPKYGPESFSGGTIPDENFNVTYAQSGDDYEFAIGEVGLESVGFAGVTVKNQKLSMVTKTRWHSSYNVTSGLMGWGLGATSSIYPGSDPSQDNSDQKAINVKPWIVSAHEQGLVPKPIFSVVLGQRKEGNLQVTGSLAIGGAHDPSSLPLTGVYATTPILKETFDHYHLKDEYAHYTIAPDGIVVNGQFHQWVPEKFPGTNEDIFTIVDTSTTDCHFPKALIDVIANAFDPPAYFDEDDGAHVTFCNATVPTLALRIGGKDLPVSPGNVFFSQGTFGNLDDRKYLCELGFQYPLPPPWGGAIPYTIGTTFLGDVLAVHDLGTMQMTFGSLKWE